ncbi:acid protease [Lecanosticta acicola]|uniref:Acid protease n=1 Tax=Lecanosticta acicola TaxID=111012 RepID=A0AAI8YWG4_9PEZI|nr:acid protease [Lecanosticta acicola]
MASHLKGLHQIKLVKNEKYQKSGLKSFGQLVRKYEITPTMPCPFTVVHELVEEGEHQFLRRFQPRTHKSNSNTVTHMVKKDSSGKVGHVDTEDVQNDSEYLAQIQIGTPPQTLSVWSTSLPNDLKNRNAGAHNLFDPSKSSTWKACDGRWKIGYGDGSTAQGTVGNDLVTVGGLNVQNQGVEIAAQLSQSFETNKGDGLMGLAFGVLNTVRPQPVHTPVENMILQSDIPKDAELFTAYLTNRIDGVPPCYTFGYIDQVDSTAVTINGNRLPLAGNSAIMDTGTTLAMVDDQTCKNIYAAIPGARYDANQGGWVYPSSTDRNSLPEIRLDIGGHDVIIDRDDIGFADAGGWIYGGFQSRGNMSFSIFGDTVLKSMYAIFDQGQERFGFVQKADLQATQCK